MFFIDFQNYSHQKSKSNKKSKSFNYSFIVRVFVTFSCFTILFYFCNLPSLKRNLIAFLLNRTIISQFVKRFD